MKKLEDLPRAERIAWQKKINKVDYEANEARTRAIHWHNQLIAVLEGREPTCYPPGHPKLKEQIKAAKQLIKLEKRAKRKT